jgi:amidase
MTVEATRDLTFKPATELIGLMAARELSPVELLEACLARIEALDGEINAFTHMLVDEAQAAAVESEARIQRGDSRPLEGLPVPIKDLALVSGTPLTMGSRMSMEFPIMVDSEVVARLRSAGAVIPGKTHMPEFGSTISSESLKFGATRNPWDLERSPGGSSSGAAAAVAGGLVPVAHGADGGGSLRIPAACCGLFTMKPTRARISQEPIGDITDNNTFGFLTHNVADNALLIDNVEGSAFGDPYWSSALDRPLLEEVGADPGRLRIGWTVKPPIPVPVDREWAAAVEDAARLCEELGHEVEPHDLDWNDEEGQGVFLDIWSAEFSFVVEQLKRFGMDPDLLEPHNRALWELGQRHSAADFLDAQAKMHQFLKRMMESWKTFDVILTPGLAQPQPRIGWLFEESETDPLSPLFPRSGLVAPFCANFNFSGQPAASLPLAWAADGMPIGVQAVGRLGDEATLFRLSAQLEEARPWAHRRPPVS